MDCFARFFVSLDSKQLELAICCSSFCLQKRTPIKKFHKVSTFRSHSIFPSFGFHFARPLVRKHYCLHTFEFTKLISFLNGQILGSTFCFYNTPETRIEEKKIPWSSEKSSGINLLFCSVKRKMVF